MLLTSATTIAVLLPLLTERSLQTQFLIPIAASVVFGLAATTEYRPGSLDARAELFGIPVLSMGTVSPLAVAKFRLSENSGTAYACSAMR